MSSYSVASGLRKMSHDPTLLSINTPDNNYDVIIQFYSARVQFNIFILNATY